LYSDGAANAALVPTNVKIKTAIILEIDIFKIPPGIKLLRDECIEPLNFCKFDAAFYFLHKGLNSHFSTLNFATLTLLVSFFSGGLSECPLYQIVLPLLLDQVAAWEPLQLCV
jgi:hypothetical protein